MKLKTDLYTVYGDLLLEKDTEVSAAVVRKIRQKGEKHKQVRVALKNTDIFADFQKVFDDKRYINMFKGPVSKSEICNIAGKLRMENDLIFELSYMKNNLPYTYDHVLIVTAFSIKLALTFRPEDYDMEVVSHCGFTHDIGKTRIFIGILNKTSKLTREERSVIETHPVIGYLLLNYYLKSDRRDCTLANLEHHERLDGSGYPNRIKRIHKYTQLISPIDVMDALMTRRSYRTKAFSLRAALDYLIKQADMNRFDKNTILTLISFARKDKPDIRKMYISEEPREALPEELTHDKYR